MIVALELFFLTYLKVMLYLKALVSVLGSIQCCHSCWESSWESSWELAEKKETKPGKVHYVRAGTIHYKEKPAVLSRVMWPQTLCGFMGIVLVSTLHCCCVLLTLNVH